jgi:hypothetical protein
VPARSRRSCQTLDRMNTTVDRLEKWKQISLILSAVALPIVLAVIGYFVRQSLAEAGLKKDYVQMAIAILKEPPSKENVQLRQWAISVLDKNSPVPIPAPLKSELVSNQWLTTFFEGATPLKYKTECKSVPNSQTLEWLLANDPERYTRCPNGEVGERVIDLAAMKRPRTAASAGMMEPTK